MSDAAELVMVLQRRGVDLALAGDRIRYRPKGAVTPELRSALIEHKADLLRLLADESHQVGWRVEAMRPRLPPTGPIPPLYARPLPLVRDGCCLSCGEPLTAGNKYHCEPCVRAAWIALREVRRGVEPDA